MALPRSLLALAAVVAAVSVATQLARVRYHAHAPHTGGGGVIVTGASSGIGEHVARTLAARGWTVYAGVRSEAAAAELAALGLPTLVPVTLDVTNPASRDAALAWVAADLAARGGLPLVALVNNAGVSRHAVLEFEPEASARAVFEVNYWGALAMTRGALPALRASRGRVIQISSLSARMPGLPRLSSYASSKHALEAASDALRLELRPLGVAVAIVQPGYVRTDISVNAARAAGGPTGAPEAPPGSPAAETYPRLYPRGWADATVARIAQGESPAVVSAAVVHALESEYPRARYVVAGGGGFPGWLVAALADTLPTPLWDALMVQLGHA
jgi:NAD(P)-dependent dehydrogenase (short-subunit alcohol dehydrogenase family)